jgi:methylmalonyl-CoA mutase cobalamin-binding domain/chain
VQSELKNKGISPILIVGGNIPRRDRGALEALGVDGVFGPGTPFHDVVDFVRERVPR